MIGNHYQKVETQELLKRIKNYTKFQSHETNRIYIYTQEKNKLMRTNRTSELDLDRVAMEIGAL